ncbi:hypothetical protein MP228_003854 [Amoeboaphelidium protococcarum]|nr:hypothetical protein MP228_003854 [Amoeboaphelidium protococcarum]
MQTSNYVFVDVSDEDLKILNNTLPTPEHTSKVDENWYRNFSAYLNTQSVDPNTPWFQTVHNKKLLSQLLQDFVKTLRKSDGQEYKPSSLQTIVHSVFRQLKRVYPDCGINFATDPLFKNVWSELKSKLSQLQTDPLGEVEQASYLTTDELQRLINFYDPNDAEGLIMLVAIYLAYYCSFSGQQLVEVKRDLLQKMADSTGTWYQYELPLKKSRGGRFGETRRPRFRKIPPDDDQVELRLKPVALISKYLTKSLPGGHGRLFVHKDTCWKTGTIWYSNRVIGVNWFRDQLKVAAKAVGIERRITWHCFSSIDNTSQLLRLVLGEDFKNGSTTNQSDAFHWSSLTQEDQQLAMVQVLQHSIFHGGQSVRDMRQVKTMDGRLVTPKNNKTETSQQLFNTVPRQFHQHNLNVKLEALCWQLVYVLTKWPLILVSISLHKIKLPSRGRWALLKLMSPEREKGTKNSNQMRAV